MVNLQTSPIAGTTANLYSRDLALEALLREAMPAGSPAHFAYGGMRIGALIDGYDRWWRRDPNGPRELAEAIEAHAPAYFDTRVIPAKVNDLKASAARAKEWSQAPSTIRLAIMLYRAGERDEACKVLGRKLSKFTPKEWLDDV